MLNLQKLQRKHVRNTSWPKEKKLQAVTQYLALGNMALVAATTGISHGLLRQWKAQPWWKEFEKEIRNTENLKLDDKLTKLVDKSLDAVADRLENGEAVWDSKSGTIQRKPVNMKDSAKVANDMLTKRELLRGNATSRTEAAAIPMQDQLKLLAAEFARMTSGKPIETIDVEMVEILNGDVDDALHEEWEEGLQEGTELGEDDSSPESEGTRGAESVSEGRPETGDSPQG